MNMNELLWIRPDINERYFQKGITIFGHTPTKYYGAAYAGRMLKTPTWIDIDTGALRENRLCCCDLRMKRLFMQENDRRNAFSLLYRLW